jgi:hypothetical protein
MEFGIVHSLMLYSAIIGHCDAGLPDVFIQKSQFCYILEGLGLDHFGIFYDFMAFF